MVEVCSTELEHAIGNAKYKEVLDYYRNNFAAMKEQEYSKNVGR
jgi:hypothetical protein